MMTEDTTEEAATVAMTGEVAGGGARNAGATLKKTRPERLELSALYRLLLLLLLLMSLVAAVAVVAVFLLVISFPLFPFNLAACLYQASFGFIDCAERNLSLFFHFSELANRSDSPQKGYTPSRAPLPP